MWKSVIISLENFVAIAVLNFVWKQMYQFTGLMSVSPRYQKKWNTVAQKKKPFEETFNYSEMKQNWTNVQQPCFQLICLQKIDIFQASNFSFEITGELKKLAKFILENIAE